MLNRKAMRNRRAEKEEFCFAASANTAHGLRHGTASLIKKLIRWPHALEADRRSTSRGGRMQGEFAPFLAPRCEATAASISCNL
jgi:hypothetical protein